MALFSGLTLGDKFYSAKWILKNYEDLDLKQFDPVVRNTLLLCGEWLSGKEHFEIHTSGSTGKPKAIFLSRQQMALSAKLTGQVLNLKGGEKALVCLSPSYIAGFMMLVRGMELNLELTVVEPTGNPFASLDLDDNEYHFDFTALVPLQLYTILNSGTNSISFLNKMKAVLVGGAPVSFNLTQQLLQVKAPIYQTFGMTETVSHIALRRLNGAEASGCYNILPTVEIGQDERGCLTIKSPLTNDQRIVTNDLVELLSKDSFIWLGRIDNVINSGGMKVQAEKVEHAIAEAMFELNDDLSKRELFVCGLPDEKFGEIVTAVFEGKKFPSELEEKLQQSLFRKLSRYEIPGEFRFVDSFIRTATGKIDRNVNLVRLK